MNPDSLRFLCYSAVVLVPHIIGETRVTLHVYCPLLFLQSKGLSGHAGVLIYSLLRVSHPVEGL